MSDISDPSNIANHPWGHELTWVDNDRYTGQLITLLSGHTMDRWEWNSKRDRAVLVLKGMMRIELSDSTDAVHRVLLPGQGYRLEAGVPDGEAGVLSPGDVVSLFGRRRDSGDVRH
jgi:hypothetical protein